MLLDRPTTAASLNRPDILDTTKYPDAYLNQVLQDVEDEINSFLRWTPSLTVHTDEEGMVQLLRTGEYAGRYMAELRAKHLVGQTANDIFGSFKLTYALAIVSPAEVNLNYVTVNHSTGIVFALASGAVEALAGLTFGYVPSFRNVAAVGYKASYVSGYATGINDPDKTGGGTGFTASVDVDPETGHLINPTILTPGSGFVSPPFLTLTGGGGTGGGRLWATISNGQVVSLEVTVPGQYTSAPTVGVDSGPFPALPLPEDYRQAALLLVRERLAFEDAQNAQLGNPMAGFLVGARNEQVEERYQPHRANDKEVVLGYGGPLARAAQNKLERHRRKPLPTIEYGLP